MFSLKVRLAGPIVDRHCAVSTVVCPHHEPSHKGPTGRCTSERCRPGKACFQHDRAWTQMRWATGAGMQCSGHHLSATRLWARTGSSAALHSGYSWLGLAAPPIPSNILVLKVVQSSLDAGVSLQQVRCGGVPQEPGSG